MAKRLEVYSTLLVWINRTSTDNINSWRIDKVLIRLNQQTVNSKILLKTKAVLCSNNNAELLTRWEVTPRTRIVEQADTTTNLIIKLLSRKSIALMAKVLYTLMSDRHRLLMENKQEKNTLQLSLKSIQVWFRTLMEVLIRIIFKWVVVAKATTMSLKNFAAHSNTTKKEPLVLSTLNSKYRFRKLTILNSLQEETVKSTLRLCQPTWQSHPRMLLLEARIMEAIWIDEALQPLSKSNLLHKLKTLMELTWAARASTCTIQEILQTKLDLVLLESKWESRAVPRARWTSPYQWTHMDLDFLSFLQIATPTTNPPCSRINRHSLLLKKDATTNTCNSTDSIPKLNRLWASSKCRLRSASRSTKGPFRNSLTLKTPSADERQREALAQQTRLYTQLYLW